MGRVFVIEMVIEMGSRGFSKDLVANAIEQLRREVEALLTGLKAEAGTTMVEEPDETGSWHQFLDGERL